MITMTTDTIKVKQEAKKRKPLFRRSDAHKKSRLGEGWRKPTGLQNKMRLHKRGYRVTVKPGYGTPVALQNSERSGLKIVHVSTLAQLQAIDPKTQAAEIAGVGRKKKEALIEAAKKANITIANLSVARYQEKTKALLAAKEAVKNAKEAAAKKKAAKEEKAAKAAEKKAAEAKKKEEEASQDPEKAAAAEEEKKEAEKKEKEKVLTSKKGL